MSWFRFHEVETGVVDLVIDGFIGDALVGAGEFRQACRGVTEVRSVWIDSLGGCCETALRVARLLHPLIRGVPVMIRRAYSAAALVALAADERIVFEGDVPFMLHGARVAVFGTAEELGLAARKIEGIRARMVRWIADRAGCGEEQAFEWTGPREHYFSFDEAVRIGLATRLQAPSKASPFAPSVPGTDVGPTPEERLVLDLVTAAGPIPTSNPARLRREVLSALTVKPNSGRASTCGGAGPGGVA